MTSIESLSINILTEGDLNDLRQYLLGLSEATVKRFGPHGFDESTLKHLYIHQKGYKGYVAKFQDLIIAYTIVKTGYLEHDRPRLSGYDLILNNKTDCTIAPSVADSYQGGDSYERDSWLFDVEAYHKELEGLSEFSLRFRRGLEIEVDELFFTGDGSARGIEFLLQKKQGKYTDWGAYTLGKVRHTFPGFNDGLEFPALHDQRHEFKMAHSIEIDGWNLSATFVYGSGKPFSEPEGQYSVELLDGRSFNYVGVGAKNGSRLPAYHRLDLAAHYRFPWGKAKGDIGISFFNFYNRKNIWYIKYDFMQEPVLVSEVTYLGMTPNFSFSINF